jgi:uncharacterized Ntn-hydrolase superfamily protein
MTFSIVARTADARMFGVAIASSSPAVAARCAYARAGSGAVATQNITDPSLGPAILAALVEASGAQALGTVGSAIGRDAAAAGNLLAGADVPAAMIAAFDTAAGHLGARLLQALHAGVACGGEAGPIHSAGLLVVRDVAWPIVDLRVDWSDADPVAELGSIWDIYAPQIDDYVRRALDPAQAPRFGVRDDP